MNTVSDVEKTSGKEVYVHGYPSLAGFIASNPGHSTAIYRRFDYLSARTLLLLQSELVELEAKLRAYDESDLLSNTMEANDVARDFAQFSTRAENDKASPEAMRLDLLHRIKDKLKEFREAMLLEHRMLSLPQPSNQAFTAFEHKFWSRGAPTGHFPTLEGHGRHILDDKGDLMSVGPRNDSEDRLTRLLRTRFAICFPEKQSRDPNIVHISTHKIAVVVTVINILLAAAFLFGAIYNLYYVQEPHKTLALITAYTVAFALAVGLLTNARPSEIFGACAAYAAVLVVFVSGNLGNTGGNGSGKCASCNGTVNGIG